jgi:hypothetical protein
MGPGNSNVTVRAMTSNISRPKDAIRARYSAKKSRPMKGTRGILSCTLGVGRTGLAIHMVGEEDRRKHGWEQATCPHSSLPELARHCHMHVKVTHGSFDRSAHFSGARISHLELKDDLLV